MNHRAPDDIVRESAIEKFLANLENSKLLTVEQLKRVRDFYLKERPDLNPLCDWMIQERMLTPWQVSKLRSGRRQFQYGEFRLLEQRGAGRTAEVYKAQHIRNNEVVALKFLSGALASNAELVERFRREFRAAASLSHPNVVSAKAIFEEKGLLFMVLEFVEGITVKEWIIGHGKAPPAFGAEIIRQAALGLQHAHDRGLVHRNVKPSKMMLADGKAGDPIVVKLLDFGLTRFLGQSGEKDLTAAGDVVGTADYIAPEQAVNNKNADARSDVYSLGCSFFEILTGKLPFRAANAFQSMLMRAEQPAPRVTEVRPDVPDGIADVIAHMMEREPAKRPQSAREVAEALAPFATAHRTE